MKTILKNVVGMGSLLALILILVSCTPRASPGDEGYYYEHEGIYCSNHAECDRVDCSTGDARIGDGYAICVKGQCECQYPDSEVPSR